MSYCYSFSPELEQEWTWSEKYPPQPEILRYVKHVADRFDLRKDITFNTTVVSSVWDDQTKRWTVTTDGGETVIAQFVVMATGCLSVPKAPDIPGVDKYRGRLYHTADWPHDGADFTGQRIAVIGTGSSGIQCIPILAEQAADTTVFQRTPVFSLPARNRQLTDDEVAERKANYRRWREQQRTSGFGVPVEAATKSALEVSDDERNATYRAAWEEGSLIKVLSSYTDLMIDIGGQRHRSGVRAKPDPPDRQRSGRRRGALSNNLSGRCQTPLPGHRLLRDVQQGQRPSGESARDPDCGNHREGHPHHRGELRLRRDRPCYRLRRDDRRVDCDRHRRTEWTQVGRQVEGWTARLSGTVDRRLSRTCS